VRPWLGWDAQAGSMHNSATPPHRFGRGGGLVGLVGPGVQGIRLAGQGSWLGPAQNVRTASFKVLQIYPIEPRNTSQHSQELLLRTMKPLIIHYSALNLSRPSTP
jgi:hypothetical protein